MAEKILHKIKAYLYDNRLTPETNDFMARVAAEKSLSIADICTSAATRGGADISADSMSHAVDLFFKEMGYLLCDGFAVNTGYFNVTPTIRGVFESPTDTFDPRRHSIAFQFIQGEEMRRELEQVEVEILGVAETGSFIGQVTDVKTTKVNSTITPGFNLRITGNKIRVAGERPENGIAFRNISTNAVVAVDASDIVINNPSELIIIIPALPAGKYQLEITTQFSTNKHLLKEPHTSSFEHLLTVS